MFTLLFSLAAQAADWEAIQGTERGHEDQALRPWGFLQLVGDDVLADGGAVHADVRRARVGFRGAIPGTDGDVAWLIAAEFGRSALTRTQPVVLTDASITFSQIPYARVRIGQFKLPLMDEALESNPLAAPTINPSNAVTLLSESRVTDGAYTSGSGGYRDFGAQVFDAIPLGKNELAYALMVSQGRAGTVAPGPPTDVTGRLRFSHLLDAEASPTDPHRPELSLIVWRDEGTREHDGAPTRRRRQGVSAHLESPSVRARVELVHASGMLESGGAAPAAGPPVIVPDGVAYGGTALVHGELAGVGGTASYSELWRDARSDAALRVFRTLTLGAGYAFTPRARVMADVELRSIAAPHDAADVPQPGPRVSLQVVAVF